MHCTGVWLRICIGQILLMLAGVVSGPVNYLRDPENLTGISRHDDQQPKLFQGDMAGVNMNKLTRNGILTNRWPNNQLFYEISNEFNATEQSIIIDAIADLNNATASFRALPRQPFTRDYVFIQKGRSGSGCWSFVGKQSNRQIMNLEVPTNYSKISKDCVAHGKILHELVHAVGFYHEQSRPDRDKYVEINWDNIENGHHHNFNTYTQLQVTTFGQPYDFASLMHYSRYDFAKNKTIWTIRPRPPWNISIGQRKKLSPIDIRKINAMYPPISSSNSRPSHSRWTSFLNRFRF